MKILLAITLLSLVGCTESSTPPINKSPIKAGMCLTSNDINIGTYVRINSITNTTDGVFINYTYTDGSEVTDNSRDLVTFDYRYNAKADCAKFESLSRDHKEQVLKEAVERLERRMDDLEKRKHK